MPPLPGFAITTFADSGFNENDALLIRRPVMSSSGRRVGTLDARVLLSSVLPTDSVQLILAGAALRIRDRETGEVRGVAPRSNGGALTLVSRRVSLLDPPFDLELAASDARFVEPFTRAAKLGLAFLFAVTAVAIALTGFLSRRLTASVERLVDATAAVAAGDLDRTVTADEGAEFTRLADAFNTMTESLRRTLRELGRREALAAVGEFAATISHEVRNALTAVRLDLQRLHERLEPESPDRARVGRVLRNVTRLDSIVTGSLRIARVNPESMRVVALDGVLHAAVGAAEQAFLETATRVEIVHSDQERMRVRGDAPALERMFLNLLINAAQAMDPGGIARVTIEPDGNRVTVLVSDTGRGIASEMLESLGQPFLSSKPGGTGLGFPIARQIATMHDGDITVIRTSASGTTVAVALPLAASDQTSTHNVSAAGEIVDEVIGQRFTG